VSHLDRKVVILGTGGHGKVIADIVLRSGDQIVGFLDDRESTGTFLGVPVLGLCSEYQNYPDAEFIIAIGSAQVRKKLAEQMRGVRWYTAIHPAACVSTLDVSIGEGCAVMPHAVINPGTRIGRHCIINTGAIVEHDNVLEDYVHAAVGAKLCGTVHIGEQTWIGAGTVVRNNLSVCGHCMIGAGAAVVQNITEPGTYVGVPARRVS